MNRNMTKKSIIHNVQVHSSIIINFLKVEYVQIYFHEYRDFISRNHLDFQCDIIVHRYPICLLLFVCLFVLFLFYIA